MQSRFTCSSSALLGLGRCQLELKDYEAAVVSLERLLQPDPTSNRESEGGRTYSGMIVEYGKAQLQVTGED